MKAPRRAHDSLVGEVLAGRYRIVRMLGKGGMGAVYEAVQDDLGRRVAIKVLHPFLSDDYEHITRFKREARAAASLGHPNVVQVTDFQSGKGELAFLVMEYLEGRSLRDVMKEEKKLEVERVVPIVLQVLSALGTAHAAGIVHRDLKPGNIFLIEVSGVGEIAKLLDFGIAKMTEGTGYTLLTRTGVTLGTPVYMAPEQVTGRQIDGRTDIYAIGVIAYRALAGRAPFKSTDVGDLLRQVLIEPTPPIRRYRPDLDEGLADVVERAIAKAPIERYQTTAAMAEALAPWCRGRPLCLPAPQDAPGTSAGDRGGVEVDPEDSRIETILARPTPTGDRSGDRFQGAIEMPTAPDLAVPMEAAEAAIAAAIAADDRRGPRRSAAVAAVPGPTAPPLPPAPAPAPGRASPARRAVAVGLALAAATLLAGAATMAIVALRRPGSPARGEVRAGLAPSGGGPRGPASTGRAGEVGPPPGPSTAGTEPGAGGAGASGDAGAAPATDAAAEPAAGDGEVPMARHAPIRCGAGQVLTVEDVVIDHPTGIAVRAGRGCRLTLRRCALRGRRFGLQVRDGAQVRVEGCTLWGRRFGLHVTGESRAELLGGEVSGRSGAIQTTGRSSVVLRGTRLRGRVFEGTSTVERID